MEALYSKLYDKYTKLKVKKASEIEQLSLDQEEKFKTYVSAADELIGYLTNEKDMLHAQLGELRQEIASIRSAKDEEQQQYEKMLLEANEKNKQLSEEIERLQRKELDSSDIRSPRSPLSNSNSTKRKRITIHENENEVVDKDNLISGVFYNDATQAKCCRPRLGGTGDAASSNCCMFQELVECLVDLKFSVGTSSDDTIQITAVHESSGYTFSLGWVKNNRPGEEETMMIYRVSTLGTFERVAPEWMRDVILFSNRMLRTFFTRLSVYFQSL
ncbi:hypothetical protein HanPSC8_Chr06g0259771 [Helianthus annuus]|uniref:uncharacterized protein LOC110937263 isoform X3 n=1 Tax=Helianthus annuus TaxID=4232 RepID=UPI000B908261|nr:uncharacterized protein LOC110937263 isoform X3 [Helianthus annuus]KAJ0567844.1 hypothetical protein HanIR_Chr06g0289461 [Helianthus annuus]KAJ0916272.1 hypothetical protein HanPSC8_Chr06g0259771 [Helianthus annuus]